MPKRERDKAPTLVGCDGCGMVVEALSEPDHLGFEYCPVCEKNRAGDPAVRVNGRVLTVSELYAQAKDDKALAAALPGDSVQEQIRAAKGER